jgi:ABC-type amino acid transport substrate-binding protein
MLTKGLPFHCINEPNMKKMIFLILLYPVIGFSQGGILLRLASDVWPPFTNVKGEKAIANALVREALSRSQIREQTKIIEFGDLTEGIRNEIYDGSAALWKDPEREAYLLFSEPYLENRLILVGRKGSPVDVADFSKLEGKTIGIVGHYAYGEKLAGVQEVDLVPGQSDQENLDKMLQGELDYILVDELLIQYLMTYQPEETSRYLAIGSTPMIRRGLHFALRKNLDRSAFIIERFNQAIQKMIRDGSYNRILELNWIRADVDGDGRLELVHTDGPAGELPPVRDYMLRGSSSPDMKAGQIDRYYFDGQVYEGWQNVPKKYKNCLQCAYVEL